jgi:hypothetical protein
MKSFAPLLLLIVGSFTTYSQIDFEKGYHIDNNGNRVEGLIKNVDWDNNPLDFLFQHVGDAEPRRVTIEQSAEFGISNVSRFVRATVDIDRSSEKVSELSAVRAPQFNKEQIFLKTLVQGKASLYEYVGGGFQFDDQVKFSAGIEAEFILSDIKQNETCWEATRSGTQILVRWLLWWDILYFSSVVYKPDLNILLLLPKGAN